MRRVLVALVALAAVLGWVPAAGASTEAPAPAAAQEQEPTTTTTTTQLPADAQTIGGLLRYEDEDGEPVGAEGISVTIESADGSFSQTVESDADGAYLVAVPGPGAYTVTLDPDTLPDEIVLRNADRTSLDVVLRPGQSRNVLFPLDFGEAAKRNVSTTADRAARLTFQGIRFGLIIAMAAIGLSLIFGTTGLVNFSHGEMVTFGALVAYFFNVTIGWHLYIAAPLAIAVGALAGAIVDRLLWRPLRERGTGLIAMLVVSIGLSITLR
jgi:neutral amino acid transport system permease protein